MVVELGEFTRRAMEGRLGCDLAAGVRAAVKHYRRRLESPRQPLALPRYLRADTATRGNPLEVAIGAEAEATVKREAARQQATPQQILGHAILIYLADIDTAASARDPLDPPAA